MVTLIGVAALPLLLLQEATVSTSSQSDVEAVCIQKPDHKDKLLKWTVNDPTP